MRDRQTDRQTDRQRQTQRETDRHRDTDRENDRERDTDRQRVSELEDPEKTTRKTHKNLYHVRDKNPCSRTGRELPSFSVIGDTATEFYSTLLDR